MWNCFWWLTDLNNLSIAFIKHSIGCKTCQSTKTLVKSCVDTMISMVFDTWTLKSMDGWSRRCSIANSRQTVKIHYKQNTNTPGCVRTETFIIFRQANQLPPVLCCGVGQHAVSYGCLVINLYRNRMCIPLFARYLTGSSEFFNTVTNICAVIVAWWCRLQKTRQQHELSQRHV